MWAAANSGPRFLHKCGIDITAYVTSASFKAFDRGLAMSRQLRTSTRCGAAAEAAIETIAIPEILGELEDPLEELLYPAHDGWRCTTCELDGDFLAWREMWACPRCNGIQFAQFLDDTV